MLIITDRYFNQHQYTNMNIASEKFYELFNSCLNKSVPVTRMWNKTILKVLFNPLNYYLRKYQKRYCCSNLRYITINNFSTHTFSSQEAICRCKNIRCVCVMFIIFYVHRSSIQNAAVFLTIIGVLFNKSDSVTNLFLMVLQADLLSIHLLETIFKILLVHCKFQEIKMQNECFNLWRKLLSDC